MEGWLEGLLEGEATLLDTLIGLGVLALVAAVAALVARLLLVRGVHRLTEHTDSEWDNALVSHGLFNRLAQIVPALVIYFGAPLLPGLAEEVTGVLRNVSLAWMALMGTLAVSGLLAAANTIYEQRQDAVERPIKGYVQVAQIVVYALGLILVVAALMDRSPVLLLSGLGAMTAIVMLVFKDTILSLVASVQLSTHDMVRVGDWIEMPQYHADGDVIDIALHTVKVQNWDKTITTIPTHKLISDSFRNWRGMSVAGGRRIKRALHIDISSIRFLHDEETDRFSQFALLEDYVARKKSELSEYNASVKERSDAEVNLRRLTNIGTFRAYVFNYLKNHPKVHPDMTLLVRQLPPGPAGLPLELYLFSKDTEWAKYEDLQADIFDHVLAIAPEFGLRIYQQPAGHDLRGLGALPDGEARGELE